jgi:hypothetical protein
VYKYQTNLFIQPLFNNYVQILQHKEIIITRTYTFLH